MDQKIGYHFIFDVKSDLERKARLVAGRDLNKNVPKHTSYTSVVSRESVRICFTLAALNYQDILSDDVSNTYLNAKRLETCNIEVKNSYLFGPSAIGRTAQIVRALYGIKSSGNAWKIHLSNILECQLVFKQCYVNNDVWMRPSRNKKGDKVHNYICIYVDDIPLCSANPKEHMSALGVYVNLKLGSVGSPKRYLGIDIKRKLIMIIKMSIGYQDQIPI